METADKKKLFWKLFLIALPFGLALVIDVGVLPVDFFTFRSYEAIRVSPLGRGLLPGPFYPNTELSRTEVGDLGAYTQYQADKQVVWQTDDSGHRNSSSTLDSPVVVVGDSTAYGNTLSQDQLLSVRLQEKLGKNVYNFSPAVLNDYLSYIVSDHKPLPKVIVFTEIERSLRGLSFGDRVDSPGMSTRAKRFWQNFLANHHYAVLDPPFEFTDRLIKMNMYNYLRARVDDFFQPRQPAFVYNTPSPVVFLEGAGGNVDMPDAQFNSLFANIKAENQQVKKLGIRLVFVPVPNKENFYWRFLPGQKQPTLLPRLIAALKASGVETADTQTAFDIARDKAGLILYQPDDTHWNAQGADVAATLIAGMIKSGPRP